ncbi:MAG: glycosyltransferase [Deltaproteobacteria bacterium]|nr:glycosyltransferase [Deltaproteobacteria bacterium]
MIRKHEPVTEEDMLWGSPKNTVCEAIRGIYNLTKDPDIRLKCREATAMAKSMSAKLSEYKRNWKNGFFDDNENFPHDVNKKPIDVLFLCWDDNSNTGYRFWMCAKYLGLNAVMFKGKPHAFGYPAQAPIHPSLTHNPITMTPTTLMAPGIESLVESSNVIHLIASTFPMSNAMGKQNVIVQHGGTAYRQKPEASNAAFNKIVSHSIIQCPDLLGLGAKNEKWIYYPVDTGSLKPDFTPKGDKIVIGHFPSNRENKGSATIERVINRLSDLPIKYIGSSDRVSWPENLDRMRMCDIIVEGCNASQGNKVYGEWGNTALEASALGCAVVTHCLSKDKYEKEFGPLGPVIANSEQELEDELTKLIQMKDLTPIKKRCREWAVNNHSIPATATRLWDLVYKDFFV